MCRKLTARRYVVAVRSQVSGTTIGTISPPLEDAFPYVAEHLSKREREKKRKREKEESGRRRWIAGVISRGRMSERPRGAIKANAPWRTGRREQTSLRSASVVASIPFFRFLYAEPRREVARLWLRLLRSEEAVNESN